MQPNANSYPITGTQVIRGTEFATTRTEPPELESAAIHNQPHDGISLKSYQPQEFESAIGWIQL